MRALIAVLAIGLLMGAAAPTVMAQPTEGITDYDGKDILDGGTTATLPVETGYLVYTAGCSWGFWVDSWFVPDSTAPFGYAMTANSNIQSSPVEFVTPAEEGVITVTVWCDDPLSPYVLYTYTITVS